MLFDRHVECRPRHGVLRIGVSRTTRNRPGGGGGRVFRCSFNFICVLIVLLRYRMINRQRSPVPRVRYT